MFLTGNTRAQWNTDWEGLKSACQSVERNIEVHRRNLLKDLDLSVAQTAADVNNAADKLIEQLTAAVRADQDIKINQLGLLHETARGKVEDQIKEKKNVLNKSKQYLNSNEHLLKQQSISESIIRKKQK